jgi:type I restriction enzyme S subunit
MEVVESRFKETEIGLIPEDWEVVKLGEVAEISSGGSAPQGKEYFVGNNPFIRVQHLDNDNYIVKGCDYITDEAVKKYKLKLFPKDTIIFPKSGASIYLEKRAKLPFDAYIVSHLMAVRSKSHLLLQDYLFFNLVSKKLSKDKADNYPTLNISEISQVLIPLPPLEEQKAIADILSAVQNAIEKTEKVINATKQLKKSMMKHLFTYGAVAVGEIDKVKLKESEIGLIPEHWEVVRLGQVVKTIKGKKPKILSENPSKNSLPYLTAEYFRYGIPNQFVNIEVEKELPVCKKEDVVLIWDGSKAGQVFTGLEGILASTMVKINPIINNLDKSYLYHFLTTKFDYLNSQTTGSTIPHINKTVFLNLLISFPPLDEQQKIANILTTIDQKIQAEEKKKEALQNLFKTLLQQLMTGKIRVKKTKT